jgi:hypothetical protein
MIAKTSKFRFPPAVLYALMLVVPMVLAYLLFASQYGFYNDDWYLIYAGHSQGIQKFVDVYAIDRPARALVVGAQYALFGDYAPAYSYSAFLLRLAAALGFTWILRRVWPKAGFLSLVAPLLFAIYPGFLDQVNAFDFQSHLVSLALAVFSIAFTVESIKSSKRPARIVFSALSLLFALAYLPLMEYYIGMEGLRFLLVLQLVTDNAGGPLTPKVLLRRSVRGLWAALPAYLGVAGFFIWRVFFFNSERGATDITSMFSGLAGSGLRGLWMLVHVLQDLLNTIVLAWGVPAYQMAFGLRLKDFLLAFGIALVGAFFVLWAFQRIYRSGVESVDLFEPDRWSAPVAWIGILAVLAALIPVALGDRHVQFPSYNRFTLPASLGACMAAAAFLYRIKSGTWRMGALGVMCALALLTHLGNASAAVDQAQSMRDFWWQVAWRAPGLQPGTTLVGNYPVMSIVEDYFVWGPANLVYYPHSSASSSDSKLTTLNLNAVVPSSGDLQSVEMGGSGRRERRGFLSVIEYGDALLLTQPTTSACVNIVDGRQVELSVDEEPRIREVADRSQISRVLTGGDNPIPPAAIFGPEPEHRWCYYYEKISLARQKGDWEEAARLAEEAVSKGFHPVDRVEWFPVIQAYAYTGREDKARGILPVINEVPFLKYEACQVFSIPDLPGGKERPDAQAFLKSSFCQ